MPYKASCHEPSGESCCCGFHPDGINEECVRCKYCKMWIRPYNINNICLARSYVTKNAKGEMIVVG